MSDFTSYKLKDVCSKIGSGATPRGGKESYLAHGEIFLIRSQNVLDFSFSTEGGAYISSEQARLLDGVKIERNDVLINITGDSVARVCTVPKYIREARVNQHVAILRANPKVLSSGFLKYYLLQPQIKAALLTISYAGATRKALTKSDLEDFDIDLPELPYQHRIAEILGALDDKIELNRQMNHTLEQMAQALYKHYFVDDIDSENLPEGWRNGIVSDILTLEYGKSLREDERKGGIFPVIGSSGVVGFHNTSLVKGKGIIVGRKGNAGSIIWCDDDFYPIDTTFYVVSRFSDTRLFYTFFLLKSLNLGSYNSDSAVPGLNRNHAHDSEIVIPVESVISDFNNQTEPLFQMGAVNNSEIISLTKIRDYLLPKLISGEIILSDLQTIEQAL